MKTLSLSLIVAAMVGIGANAAPAAERSVSLTQDPLVMRLNKDEFRIVFGIDGKRCASNGCSGLIHYRVEWKTANGAIRSEVKQVSYSVSPRANRTITVDRQYFDTAEGEHTTEVVKVSVDRITCRDGADSLSL